MKKLGLIITLIWVMTAPRAQTVKGSSNHLLWRISGNGLSKPSYLFGTMHGTDKRLFYFTDSLYYALETTEGFAAELDMNTVFTQYLSYMIKDDKKRTGINKVVEPELLDKYKTQLQKKFKKPVEDISVEELGEDDKVEVTNWLRSGEMKTFMDAYLFDIAARQGKWTGGIEDAEDQFGIVDLSPAERIEEMFQDRPVRNKGMEWMINTYLKEDLELIDRSDEIWKGSKDVILLNRNVKMSFRIDSLAHVKPCLFAIGAAHLPGDSGVITLLRKKGFTVTPVSSTKRIAPEKYKFKEVERKWVDVQMRDSLFSLQMPVKPEPFDYFNSSVIDIRFYFDFGSYSAFFVMAVPTNVNSDSMKDNILDRIAENYKEQATSFSEKKIQQSGIPGREFRFTTVYGDMRIQAFVPGEFVAVTALFSLKAEGLNNKNAERFFTSFKPNPDAKLVKNETGNNNTKWKRSDFHDHAFSIEFPGKYSSRNEPGDEENTWDRKTFEFIDISAQVYYGITVDQTKEGYYADNDSTHFTGARDAMVSTMNAEVISEKRTTFRNYPAYELLLKARQDGTEVLTQLFFVNRGNRRYMLFKAYEPAMKNLGETEKFFTSFSFLPLVKPGWQQTKAPDNSFTTWAPGDFIIKNDTTRKLLTRYSLHDQVSAVTILVDKEYFPKYYWAADYGSFLSGKIKNYQSWDDSVISQKDVRNGNTDALEILIRVGNSQNVKKMRLFLNGDTLYSIYSLLPEELINEPGFIKIFDQFRLSNEKKPADIFVPKTTALLDALMSGDSVDFYTARELLLEVPFSKTDIPVLQRALLEMYRDFDTTYYYSNTNSKLVTRIKQLDSSFSSTEFIRKNYSSLGGNKEALKPFLLGLLSMQTSKESYALLKELLTHQAPDVRQSYYFNNGFYDSLELTRTLYPDILSAIENPGLGDDIADLTVYLLDSNLIQSSILVPYKDAFIRSAKRVMSLPNEEMEEESYRFISLVRLLSEINDPAIILLVRKFGQMDDLDLKMEALTGLAKMGQPIGKNEFLPLARSDEHRYTLYERLKKSRKLSLFPTDYLSQRWLGQSKVYEASFEDDPPEMIKYIGEKTAMFMDKQSKFYLYKVMYSEDDPESYYLGVAGPYSMDSKNLESNNDCTTLYWEDMYDEDKTEKYFKSILETAEEYLKKEKDKKSP